MFRLQGLRTTAYAIAATAAFTFAPAAQAQIIANGSFEDPTLTPWTTAGAISASPQALFAPPDGSLAARIDLTAIDQLGTFSQGFSVATAGTFDLGFYLGRGEAFGGQNDVPLTFRALIDGNVLSSQLPGSVTSVPFFTQLEFYSASQFLNAGSHTLAFEFSRGATSFGRGPFFVLDGVSLTPQALGAVPEPSAWALLILGFGVVGGGMRQRRRAAPALI